MAKRYATTADIPLSKDPLDWVIGQDLAVKLARICLKQHRHLLLIGPPGTGKTIIAKAMSMKLPEPREEVSVIHNPENPERPLVEIRTRDDILKEKKELKNIGKVISPAYAPALVAEKFGFRCRRCGTLSSSKEYFCPRCGAEKKINSLSPFDDLVYSTKGNSLLSPKRIHATSINSKGEEEIVVYEKKGESIVVIPYADYKKLRRHNKKRMRHVILPLNRKQFVYATGASEAELLGDIKHDPYGGHPEIGIPPFQRVVPGAVHEAHEGILYIDELATLGYLQKYILTAMQDKVYPIVGKNSGSTGASIRVDNVPCNFMLVASVNVNDLGMIIPPLRSRFIGDGYEVVVNTYMEDNEENREKLRRFVAQEIRNDGKIPHADMEATEEIIDYARRMCRQYDEKVGLSLRLRKLAGIVKMAGDLAVSEESSIITREHVKKAIEFGKTAEEQLAEKYENWWSMNKSDYTITRKSGGPESR